MRHPSRPNRQRPRAPPACGLHGLRLASSHGLTTALPIIRTIPTTRPSFIVGGVAAPPEATAPPMMTRLNQPQVVPFRAFRGSCVIGTF